jgi:branched-chain amino acid transport system ATP-binding protein
VRLRRPTKQTTASTLRAEDVTVAFSGVLALRGVSVSVRRGEILGLIGPNGSGKTTLLNVISRFLQPTNGRVCLDDESLMSLPPHRLVRRGVSRTFQGVRAFQHLTVRENIEAGAVGVGASYRDARATAETLLDEMGLREVGAAWAATLPAGMQRRLGIARALAAFPNFLLLDEPAAGLYESETDQITRLIGAIRAERRCGIVVVEHDMRVIMRLCDRVHVLETGRTIADGTPDEVRQDQRVRDAYLGPAADGSGRLDAPR